MAKICPRALVRVRHELEQQRDHGDGQGRADGVDRVPDQPCPVRPRRPMKLGSAELLEDVERHDVDPEERVKEAELKRSTLLSHL